MGYFCDSELREVPPVKFILVSGGVISGIGKGLTASSIGVLMKCCGWRVTAIKIDPYLNIDAGTMSPFEHGEVFVLADGGEVDLDLGNYERFLDVRLNKDNNITTGKVYSKVLQRERDGDYLGKTVQVVPHITNAIQDWIISVATTPDASGLMPELCVIELGGTVGDIESMPFIEALRQLRYFVGDSNFASVFVSLVPEVGDALEQKTKPTQHGVKNLSSMGLSPHLIVCRSQLPLLPETKRKLGLFCQVAPEAVISVQNVKNTYSIPLMLQQQGVCNLLIRSLQLVWRLPTRLEKWANMALSFDSSKEDRISVCIVGKYTGLSDAYLSVVRALQHAGMAVHREVVCKWVESSELQMPESNVNNAHVEEMDRNGSDRTASPGGSPLDGSGFDAAWEKMRSADAILVPGGFGDRGVEGKILAVRYAREARKPFLGICLGMQMAVVEAAREAYKEPLANSTEFNKEAPVKAVIFMPEGDKKVMGGTMRLGVRETIIREEDCLAAWLYNTTKVLERHRHRYEVNPEVVQVLQKKTDLRFVGTDTSGKRMEILELRGHPFFLGTQYHPEFESRPGRPSPPFLGFVMAAAGLPLDRASVRVQLQEIHDQDPWAPENIVNGHSA